MKIYDNSLYYRSLRVIVGFIYKKFFRQIEVRGTENIPTGEPVIFAANHQSALIDALAILLFQEEPIVFMARADMFQNKIAAKFLRSLKIAPIYRIRDGFENLSKNEKQMNGAVNVLLDKKQLCLMPEGNQGNQHKLRPLVKGLFRIAYAAEDRLDGNAHVKIVPVGIDYSYYQHAGTDLVVTYGKPIEISEYLQLYLENPANGLNVLRDELSDRISNLMHDIKSIEHYDMIYRLCCYGTPAYLEIQAENGIAFKAKTMAGLNFDARFALGKFFDKIDIQNPGKILELDTLCRRLKELPGYPSEVTEWMEYNQSRVYTVFLMIICVPIIPGFLLNFPVWYLSRKIRKSVEDTQMHNTFAFTMGMLLNAIIYLIVTLWIAALANYSDIQAILFFVFVCALGIVTERTRQSLRLPLRRFIHLFGKKKKMVEHCKDDYQNLKAAIKNLIRMSSL